MRRVTNAAFAASKRLRHFRLVRIRMFRHICFLFFWIDFSETPMQLLFSKSPVSFICFSQFCMVDLEALNV